jgi:AcrR family transcriptional regulator
MHIEQHKPANLDNKTVRRILGAALKLWSTKGIHGASLRDVAAEAGVAKSLLHYHFASKEHLLLELQDQYFLKVASEVRARLATRRPSVASGLETMDQVFDIVVKWQQSFPFALEIWRASLESAEVRARLVEFELKMQGLFQEGVMSALGPLTGRLRVTPEQLADVLHVAFTGFELRLFLTPDVDRLRRAFEAFKLMVLGVFAPEQGGHA